MLSVFLNPKEIMILGRQDPSSKAGGGWQSLLVRLQEKLDSNSGQLDLDERDLDQIQRFALDYKRGGWESRLRGVFQRSLGENLGRNI